jgi:hypothetical protein
MARRQDVVFGDGALARALAAERARRHATVLVTGGEPVPGPWLWRRADASTGEGVRGALKDATHVSCVADGPVHGLHLVARAEAGLAVTMVAPSGSHAPVEPSWNLLETGVVWGEGDALFDAWQGAAPRGWLWVPDVGPVPTLPLVRAIAAVDAVSELRGQRWRLPGTPRTLRDLAGGTWPAARRLRVPVSAASFTVGVAPALLRARAALPVPTPWTPGWGSG